MTKPTKWLCSAKTQGISPVWSESSLFAQWVATKLHADSEDWSDWVDAQADLSLCWVHMPFCWFCHEAAHIEKKTQKKTQQKWGKSRDSYVSPHCTVNYRKTPKNWDTRKNCCSHPKIWTKWLYCRIMHPKSTDGMANSVDPWSDCSSRGSLIWVYTVCSNLSVWKLRNIAVSIAKMSSFLHTPI